MYLVNNKNKCLLVSLAKTSTNLIYILEKGDEFNMINKTKEELLKELEDLQNKLALAEQDVDYWQCEYNDMEKEKDKLKRQVEELTYSGGIKDLEHFMFELSKDGLDTEELKNFIGNYVAYKQ